jgi:DNA-binding transcriptional regulator/RsmH inhibitor MraZ
VNKKIFHGRYDLTIRDSDHSIMLPSKLFDKFEMSGNSYEFIATWEDSCLQLFPCTNTQIQSSQTRKISISKDRLMKIPDDIYDLLNECKTIVLLGQCEYIELWNLDTYKKYLDNPPFQSDINGTSV